MEQLRPLGVRIIKLVVGNPQRTGKAAGIARVLPVNGCPRRMDLIPQRMVGPIFLPAIEFHNTGRSILLTIFSKRLQKGRWHSMARVRKVDAFNEN